MPVLSISKGRYSTAVVEGVLLSLHATKIATVDNNTKSRIKYVVDFS